MTLHPAPSFDVFNVYFERLYDPTMHLLLAFDGQIDEDVLKEATLRLIGANPYLGCRFAEGEGMPGWEEIAEEEWERAFVHLPAGAEMPPPPLDVRRGPQLRVGLSRREEGDLVVVTCHHGFCDVGGLTDLARRLFAAYRGIRKDPDFAPAPTGWYDRGTGRILARFSAEEVERACAAEEPFIDRWRFPAERIGRGTPRIAYRTLPPERLRRAKEFGRKHDATINDIAIGAFFLAFMRIRDEPSDYGAPGSLLTSVDLRRYLDRTEECPPMNLSVSYEITLAAGEGAGLEEVVGQVAAATKRRKANGIGPGCIRFYDRVYADGVPAIREFFDGMVGRYQDTGLKNPVLSNIGIFDAGDVLPLEGTDGRPLDLRRVCFLPCVCWPYGFLMTLSTFRDAMTIVSAFEEGPYSRETVERFLELVDGYLP